MLLNFAPPIKRKDSVKYLGIELASAISFSSLVESVIKKSKFSSEICVQVSKTYTLFCSYSMFIWLYSNINKSDQKKLKIIQNKMVRFINCMFWSKNSCMLVTANFLKLVFLKSTKDQNNLYCITCIKYIILGRIIIFDPTSILLLTYMIIIQEIADSTLTVPERVGSIGNSFYYNAIKHWNSLPNGVKEIENYAHFKRK